MRIPVHKNSPVVLRAMKSFKLNTGGGITLDFDSFQLSNTYDTVVDIEEFRFFVTPNPLNAVKYSANNGLWTQFDFGALFSVKIGSTKVPITEEFVHLRSLAEPKQWNLNCNYDLSASQIPYNSTFYSWKLRKPMSMRPGDGIRASAQLDPSVLWPVDPSLVNPDYDPPGPVFTGVDVWICAIGKLRDEPLADALEYPWAMEWNPVIQPLGGSTSVVRAYAATGENQFRNRRPSDMRVQRLVASLYARFTPTDANAPGATYSLPIDVLNYLTAAVDATLGDSMGYAIAAARTPLAALVDPRSGTWAFETNLKYDEQFPAEVFANPIPAALFPAGANVDIQPTLFPHLAIIGSQMVGVPR